MAEIGTTTDKKTILRRINYSLITLVVAINGYLVLTPFLPYANTQVRTHITKPVKVQPNNTNSLSNLNRDQQRLIIPSIQLEKPYFEGQDAQTTYQGIWHPPYSSTPDHGSNTVLIGHRFSYRKPAAAIFYDLDKVKVRDDIVLVHDHKIYHYRVFKILVVPPSDTSVEAPTREPQLTLYTCTPLWSVKNRLVIQASLVEAL